jgi:hypothetical protein
MPGHAPTGGNKGRSWEMLDRNCFGDSAASGRCNTWAGKTWTRDAHVGGNTSSCTSRPDAAGQAIPLPAAGTGLRAAWASAGPCAESRSHETTGTGGHPGPGKPIPPTRPDSGGPGLRAVPSPRCPVHRSALVNGGGRERRSACRMAIAGRRKHVRRSKCHPYCRDRSKAQNLVSFRKKSFLSCACPAISENFHSATSGIPEGFPLRPGLYADDRDTSHGQSCTARLPDRRRGFVSQREKASLTMQELSGLVPLRTAKRPMRAPPAEYLREPGLSFQASAPMLATPGLEAPLRATTSGTEVSRGTPSADL